MRVDFVVPENGSIHDVVFGSELSRAWMVMSKVYVGSPSLGSIVAVVVSRISCPVDTVANNIVGT